MDDAVGWVAASVGNLLAIRAEGDGRVHIIHDEVRATAKDRHAIKLVDAGTIAVLKQVIKIIVVARKAEGGDGLLRRPKNFGRAVRGQMAQIKDGAFGSVDGEE